jgi:hypothetical protein
LLMLMTAALTTAAPTNTTARAPDVPPRLLNPF